MATTKRSTSGRSSRATKSARGKAETTVVGVAHKRAPTRKARAGRPKEPYVINERRK